MSVKAIVEPDDYAIHVESFLAKRSTSKHMSRIDYIDRIKDDLIRALKRNYPVGADRDIINITLAALITEKGKRVDGMGLLKTMIEAILTEQRKQIRENNSPCTVCGHIAHKHVSNTTIDHLRSIAKMKRNRKSVCFVTLRKLVDQDGDSFPSVKIFEKYKNHASANTVRNFMKSLVKSGEMEVSNDGRMIVWVKTRKYGQI